MSPERLLKYFEQISEAPDAVPRLRRFILDLAIRGKLVEQNPNHEPASELLKRIEEEKTRLVKTGEIRKGKPLPPIEESGTLFEIPASWKWVPIRKITVDRGQKIPVREFSYVDVSAIDKERGLIAAPQVLTPDAAPSRARKIVQKGDVIYSCVRPYLLNIAVVEEEFNPEPIVSTAFAVLNGLGLVLPRYLWIVLRSPFFVCCVEEKMRGQAYPAINEGDFAALPSPLPPLAEQHRIVAKVDELMALCDELEVAQAKRERRRDRLVAATLHGLNNGNDSSEPGNHPTFEESPRFYFNHLPRLTTRPEHIQQLRQTILNLAVRGKLVPQDPRDETASELLKIVAAEKRRLTEEGQIRKQKPLPPIREDEVPFNVPKNWKLVRLGEVSTLITKGSTPTSYGHSFVQHGINFVKVEAIKAGLLLPENITSHINSETHKFLKRSQLKSGDFLFSIAGSIGTCAVVTEQILPANTNQALAIIRGANLAFSLRYLSYSSSSDLLAFTVAKARGGAMNNISLEDVSNFILPLPPLTEQHRIVAKVGELITLCDELEARIATTAATRRQLLEATLSEAIVS